MHAWGDAKKKKKQNNNKTSNHDDTREVTAKDVRLSKTNFKILG